MAEIKIHTVLDTDELRHWATRHADQGRAAIAQVLFDAAERYDRMEHLDTAAEEWASSRGLISTDIYEWDAATRGFTAGARWALRVAAETEDAGDAR